MIITNKAEAPKATQPKQITWRKCSSGGGGNPPGGGGGGGPPYRGPLAKMVKVDEWTHQVHKAHLEMRWSPRTTLDLKVYKEFLVPWTCSSCHAVHLKNGSKCDHKHSRLRKLISRVKPDYVSGAECTTTHNFTMQKQLQHAHDTQSAEVEALRRANTCKQSKKF